MTAPHKPAGAPSAVINGHDARSAAEPRTLTNYIGGKWVASDAKRFAEVHNPATAQLIARTPLGGAADVDRAVKAAMKAYPAWRQTPPVNRVKPLFKLKYLLEEDFDDLARVVTLEHGKTLDESRSSVRRAIDNVDLAIGRERPMPANKGPRDLRFRKPMETPAKVNSCRRRPGPEPAQALNGPL